MKNVVSRTLIEAKNPDPVTFPQLGIWERTDTKRGDVDMYVSSSFPEVPDFTCDSWCYECPVDYLDARDLGKGKIQLRHRWQDHPHVIFETTVTPEPGAVEFCAHAVIDENSPGELPDPLLGLNLCWQLKRADDFKSRPDPYPEFIKRCFIFTDEGRTFLDQTERFNIPCRGVDEKENNPPWVQMYLGVWEKLKRTGPQQWADYSGTRYIYPIIGTVSKDGKYLTAIACQRPASLSQAWHDCMHNNPKWEEDEAGSGKIWRLKVYVMKNDPDALLKRVEKDFPEAMKLEKNRL